MSVAPQDTVLENDLRNALSCLMNYMDEETVLPEYQIPRYYLEHSKAIIFLTEQKRLLKNQSGGIMLLHENSKDGKWSAPCCVYIGNTNPSSPSDSFSINFSETDYILLMLESKPVSSLIESGKLYLRNRGRETHIMDGPLGRHSMLAKNLSHDDTPLAEILCYAIKRNMLSKHEKPSSSGHSKWLEGQEILINKEDNHQYYSTWMKDQFNEDFLKKSNLPVPHHDKFYNAITHILNSYIEDTSQIQKVIRNFRNMVEGKGEIKKSDNIPASEINANNNDMQRTNIHAESSKHHPLQDFVTKCKTLVSNEEHSQQTDQSNNQEKIVRERYKNKDILNDQVQPKHLNQNNESQNEDEKERDNMVLPSNIYNDDNKNVDFNSDLNTNINDQNLDEKDTISSNNNKKTKFDFADKFQKAVNVVKAKFSKSTDTDVSAKDKIEKKEELLDDKINTPVNNEMNDSIKNSHFQADEEDDGYEDEDDENENENGEGEEEEEEEVNEYDYDTDDPRRIDDIIDSIVNKVNEESDKEVSNLNLNLKNKIDTYSDYSDNDFGVAQHAPENDLLLSCQAIAMKQELKEN